MDIDVPLEVVFDCFQQTFMVSLPSFHVPHPGLWDFRLKLDCFWSMPVEDAWSDFRANLSIYMAAKLPVLSYLNIKAWGSMLQDYPEFGWPLDHPN